MNVKALIAQGLLSLIDFAVKGHPILTQDAQIADLITKTKEILTAVAAMPQAG